jgi:hypothetical protein
VLLGKGCRERNLWCMRYMYDVMQDKVGCRFTGSTRAPVVASEVVKLERTARVPKPSILGNDS